ncbi:YggT family protein [candidate division WWE3 bacterium]|uniref:YggT family protein n=1 Tax=candidate division WWE3 bacterium TaxID=2053526 RepID=A0A955LL12_UNCKA|nr:YggT family protein [candidate division WWE3 bacterium]
MKHLLSAKFVKQLLVFVFSMMEGMLLLRVVLKLVAANPESLFVNWIYNTTYPIVYPFLGMFPSGIQGLSYEIEFSTLTAMVIYAIVGYALLYFIGLLEKPKKKY